MALPEPLARFVSKLQLQALPGAPRPPPEASITRTQLVASTSSSSSSGPAMQASSKRKAFFSDDVDVGTAPEVLSQETVEAAPLISHDTLRLMFSGGIAGALSKTCTAPLARLTILYQVQALEAKKGGVNIGGASSVKLGEAFRQVVKREGVLSLWKGNLVTIIHRLPYSAVNFATYELANQHLRPWVPNDVTRRLVAGGLSGLVACTAAYPLDLLRTRMAAQTTSNYYSGIGQSLGRIMREEGLGGWYKGLNATLLQVVPGLALNFCFYDTLKHSLTKPGEKPTSQVSFFSAVGAGFAASTLVYPLDVVRRRMQIYGQGTVAAAPNYLATCRTIWQQEGMRAFYSGIVPEYCKVLPGMAIAFVTYEALKSLTGVSKGAGGSK